MPTVPMNINWSNAGVCPICNGVKDGWLVWGNYKRCLCGVPTAPFTIKKTNKTEPIKVDFSPNKHEPKHEIPPDLEDAIAELLGYALIHGTHDAELAKRIRAVRDAV